MTLTKHDFWPPTEWAIATSITMLGLFGLIRYYYLDRYPLVGSALPLWKLFLRESAILVTFLFITAIIIELRPSDTK